MNDIVTVRMVRTHLSQLLARVEAGEEIIIARGGKPIAKLVGIAVTAKRQFGAMRGLVDIGPEFFEPLPEDEVTGWER